MIVLKYKFFRLLYPPLAQKGDYLVLTPEVSFGSKVQLYTRLLFLGEKLKGSNVLNSNFQVTKFQQLEMSKQACM
jgi:hypothetical protein